MLKHELNNYSDQAEKPAKSVFKAANPEFGVETQ